MNLPELHEMHNPIDIANIQNHQLNDLQLFDLHTEQPDQYPVKEINGLEMIGYVPDLDIGNDWKICLPESLVYDVLRWFHVKLGHPGTTRLYDSIRARFHCNRLYTICATYKCPDECFRYKQTGQGYGHLPPREALVTPWDEVAVDLIGLWKIKVNGTEYEFKALTCIDPVTNLVEIIQINDKSSDHAAQHFENLWLSRYPCPNKCVHDNGKEFIGKPL